MVKRMLIDASHAEEIRVVVANGTRLEEFDFETAAKKQLKGNFYLAKVMRVEPSLQAAFVEYGGNRHGFLPFGEIHPDYYQIPVADREALFAEQQAVADENGDGPRAGDSGAEAEDGDEDAGEIDQGEDAQTANEASEAGDESDDGEAPNERRRARNTEAVETLGGDDIDDESERRLHVSRSLLSRRYKIQEVIKKRQIMLIQVAKEERGNKGAALTTYLSLAGRYCVLMPNAVRGGGISRKIVNADDRKRLKAITNELKVPSRMAVIVRTAGLARTRAEIKRDFEYLLRQWEGIREATLESSAPVLINEEANLIRRSIRDLYSRDIEQIQIEGKDGYRIAKDFMRTLIPSQSSKVQPYRDRIPLFTHYQIESQLDAMYSPQVQLRSGGYLVINPTEALVSIDVNSGRATKQRNVEETALKTNQEAADEIARQLRLRDLAGLVVIDFIDMDENRNQRNIERRFKEAMRNDRARIQIGRISPFGLLELSRQRLRPSLLEAATELCSTCAGMGVVRATASSAVHVLRAIEEEGLRERSAQISVHVPGHIALYVLNNKRQTLSEIETRYAMEVVFKDDPSLVPPMYTIETLRTRDGEAAEGEAAAASGEDAAKVGARETAPEESEGEDQPRRRRRRRKPRTAKAGEGRESEAAADKEEASETKESGDAAENGEDGARGKRRRRGRRGGRRRGSRSRDAAEETGAEAQDASETGDSGAQASADETGDKAADARVEADAAEEAQETAPEAAEEQAAESEKKPKRRARPRRKRKTEKQSESAAEPAPGAAEPATGAGNGEQTASGDEDSAASPSAGDEDSAASSSVGDEDSDDSGDSAADELAASPAAPEADDESDGGEPADKMTGPAPRRTGWWQRVLS
ncbi:MAG: Rne/Rng family ribonuclease [Alphaproteobacteria bacterium]|nr:Rne/Rng family ribonuclease [Alphaproteobacteria bacterium]